ncbi:hypothetical protein Tco_1102662 [Tanacetum coccineum]
MVSYRCRCSRDGHYWCILAAFQRIAFNLGLNPYRWKRFYREPIKCVWCLAVVEGADGVFFVGLLLGCAQISGKSKFDGPRGASGGCGGGAGVWARVGTRLTLRFVCGMLCVSWVLEWSLDRRDTSQSVRGETLVLWCVGCFVFCRSMLLVSCDAGLCTSVEEAKTWGVAVVEGAVVWGRVTLRARGPGEITSRTGNARLGKDVQHTREGVRGKGERKRLEPGCEVRCEIRGNRRKEVESVEA